MLATIKYNSMKEMKTKMKLFIQLLFLFASATTLFAQEQFILDNKTGYCKLFLKDGKLVGACTKSFFKEFEISLTNPKLDSINLFKQLPLFGKASVSYIPNSKEKVDYQLDVKYELTNRQGFPQILMKTSDGWFAMDNLKIYSDSIEFEMDNDPEPPVTESDLLIIRKTMELLKDEKQWNRNDDRKCKEDAENKTYSLFCALYAASVEEVGTYDHRKAVMQMIRKTIVEMYPNKELEHRLRDFNNLPETNHTVLMDLLTRVESQVIKALEK